MITMDTSLMGLYRRNVIDQRTLLSYSVDRAQVEDPRNSGVLEHDSICL